VTEILCRGNKREQAGAPQPLRGLSQPFEPSFVFYNIPGSFVRFRPGQNQSATPWVAQTCRSLACLRHVFVENGANVAYIPMKSVGTYAPPWFFDPAPLWRHPRTTCFEGTADLCFPAKLVQV